MTMPEDKTIIEISENLIKELIVEHVKHTEGLYWLNCKKCWSS